MITASEAAIDRGSAANRVSGGVSDVAESWAKAGAVVAEVGLGTWLRRQRHRQGKTLRVVAGLAGISAAYLCRLENTPRETPLCDLRLAVAVRLADALGRPREEIVWLLLQEFKSRESEGLDRTAAPRR